MEIRFEIVKDLSAEDFIKVLNESGLGIRRPVDDRDCIETMLANADLIVVARTSNKIVGVARSVTDFSFACYLSDLAVVRDYQKKGIGRRLIDATQKALEDKCTLILLSAPLAASYYPAIGMTRHESAWILPPGGHVAVG